MDNKKLRNKARRRCKRFLSDRCDVCHKTYNLTIHHKVPLKFGLDESRENCVTLCGTCHQILHFLESIRNAGFLLYNQKLKNDIFTRMIYESSEEYKRLKVIEVARNYKETFIDKESYRSGS